jgi:hypothetical protein
VAAILSVALVFAAACAESADSADPTAEPEWGVGGKADGMCDPASDLCWTSTDTAAMQRLLRSEDDLGLGAQPARPALTAMANELRALGHKLTPEETAALGRIEGSIGALSDQTTVDDGLAVAAQLEDAALRRLAAAYHLAYLVPAGRAAEQEGTGKGDDPTTAGTAPVNPTGRYSPGMVESLRELRASSALGAVYATMLETSGVLDRNYQIDNADNFGEWDPTHTIIVPKGISREAKVADIISRYRRLAAFIGASAGTAGLIPVAGIAISVSVETYSMFRIHAQMVFEIAAVYGLDIREGRNLLTAVLILASDGLMAEGVDVLASSVAAPLVARTVAQKFAIQLPQDLAANLAARSLESLLKLMARKSQEAVAEAALEQGVKGLGSQILGWATLGLTIAVSAGIDWLVTEWVGERAQRLSQAKLRDLFLEGTTYLSQPAARDCAFRALGVVAWADGSVSVREQRLFEGLLAKPYYVDERQSFLLTSEERVRQAQVLAQQGTAPAARDEAAACVQSLFRSARPDHQLGLVALLYAMMEVDLSEGAAERSFYQQIVGLMTSAGMLAGSHIDAAQLAYVERATLIMLQPSTMNASPEYAATLAGILPEDTIAYLATPNAAVERDFVCGFSGRCQ